MVKDQRADLDQHPEVLEHRFDLGDQRGHTPPGLDGSERRFRQQRPSGGHGVNRVGLVQPASPPLPRRTVAVGLRERRSGLRPVRSPRALPNWRIPRPRPARRHARSTTRWPGSTRLPCWGTTRRRASTPLVSTMPTVKLSWCGSMPATGDAIMVSPAGCWRFRWVRERQECCGTSESGRTGSLQARSAPTGPSPSATRQTTGTRPLIWWSQHRAKTGP